MTCEVAVMNKRGVALAADSAVTLVVGEGQKIYQNAEKLFRLSPVAPVGIMTYGAADMMGVPWETVIKIFSHNLGERRFDRLEQYADDFLRFVEGSDSLFPPSLQREVFRRQVGGYWEGFVNGLTETSEGESQTTSKHPDKILAELIAKDPATWKEYKLIEELGEAYGDRVLSDYAEVLNEIEADLFSSFKLSEQTRQALRTVVRLLYTHNWLHEAASGIGSGIVIAGMGESEPFPVLLHYSIGAIAAGRLRFVKEEGARVDHDNDATVSPFAQTEMIDLFYEGIYPELKKRLVALILQPLSKAMAKQGKKMSPQLLRQLEKDGIEALQQEVGEKYTQPLMAAVSALPRHELATMAEALVSLTAFRARMSAAETETVGGPIDVAVISKGEGFVWVKRNELVGDTTRAVLRLP